MLNDVLFRETRRALRLNDHSKISITQLLQLHSSYQSRYSADSIASELKGIAVSFSVFTLRFSLSPVRRRAKKVASHFAQLVLLPIVTHKIMH
jgi:hypothetical protein